MRVKVMQPVNLLRIQDERKNLSIFSKEEKIEKFSLNKMTQR